MMNCTSARWRQFQGFALHCPLCSPPLHSQCSHIDTFTHLHCPLPLLSYHHLTLSYHHLTLSYHHLTLLYHHSGNEEAQAWSNPIEGLTWGRGRGGHTEKCNTRKCITGKYIWVAFFWKGGGVIIGGRNDIRIKSQVTYWSSSDPFVWREPGSRHKGRSRTEDDPWRLGHLLI